jgi:hypothetical protein
MKTKNTMILAIACLTCLLILSSSALADPGIYIKNWGPKTVCVCKPINIGVSVVDDNGYPVKGAEVDIGGAHAFTGPTGRATVNFHARTEGIFTVTVRKDGQTTSATGTANPPPGHFSSSSSVSMGISPNNIPAPTTIRFEISSGDIANIETEVGLPAGLGGGVVSPTLSSLYFDASFEEPIMPANILPFIITDYSATWESFDIQGNPTGISYETLNSNYVSSGYLDLVTGDMITNLATIVTNDLFTDFEFNDGAIYGTWPSDSNYMSFEYHCCGYAPIEEVPAITPLSFVLALLSLFGLAAFAMRKMYKR